MSSGIVQHCSGSGTSGTGEILSDEVNVICPLNATVNSKMMIENPFCAVTTNNAISLIFTLIDYFEQHSFA